MKRFIPSLIVWALVSGVSRADPSPETPFPERALSGDAGVPNGRFLLNAFSVHARVIFPNAPNLDHGHEIKGECQPLPVFPTWALDAGITGEATVLIEINEKGCVTDAKLAKTNNKVFGEASMNAVSKWKFTAPIRHGKGTTVEAEVTFLFSVYQDEDSFIRKK
jgi:TonB family protein